MQIHYNHLGYLPGFKKYAVLAAPTPFAPVLFTLSDASGHSVLGKLSTASLFDSDSGDHIAYADFSEIDTCGIYRLSVEGVETHPFAIGDAVHGELAKTALRWFYLQRSGAEKNDPVTHIRHGADLTAQAIWWGSRGIDREKTVDVRGGWWDAGDYGRYVSPAAATVTMLLFSCIANPGAFPDGAAVIPESGDGIPDILSEARFELAWIMKMQRDDGAFHHKVTFKDYPSGMPDALTDDLYLFDVSTQATAQAIGSLGLAASVFEAFDPSFAEEMRQSANKGGRWLEQTGEIYPLGGFDNPFDEEGVQAMGGPYNPSATEEQYRFFAAVGLYLSTGENGYFETAKRLFEEKPPDADIGRLTWDDGWGFGVGALLLQGNIPDAFKEKLLAAAVNSSHKTASVIAATGYRMAISSRHAGFPFTWGSHSCALGRVLFMLVTDTRAPDPQFKEAALAQINWICGINPAGLFHVTGFPSHNGVKTAHHELSWALKRLVPGAVTEGPNNSSTGGDLLLEKLIADNTPPARCFVDHADSYASNEPTIYANGSFVGVISFFV